MPSPRNPETIVNHATRYEIEIRIPGRSFTAGYTARTTKQVLLRIAQQYAADILPFIADTDPVTYRQNLLTIGPVTIAKTGRTEREVFWVTAREPK